MSNNITKSICTNLIHERRNSADKVFVWLINKTHFT